MAVFICKTDDLVFNGRAVTGADAMNLSRILGGAHNIFPDDFMGFFIGIRKPAVPLISVFPFTHKGKSMILRIAFFQFHFIHMKAPPVHTGGRPRFETEDFQPVLFQIGGQPHRRAHTVGAAGIHSVADDDHAVQVRAGTEDDSLRSVFFIQFGSHAHALSVFHDDIHDLHLFQIQVVRIFHHIFHIAVISAFIRLGTEGIYRRSFPAVQHAHLDSCRIGGDTHFPSESIYFLYKMALARSADSGIAWHHGHIVQ